MYHLSPNKSSSFVREDTEKISLNPLISFLVPRITNESNSNESKLMAIEQTGSAFLLENSKDLIHLANS